MIGAGRPWRTEGATGFGMSHRHWAASKATGRAELAAVCDLIPERAQEYAKDHNPSAAIFTDYRKMMAEAKPDFVCVSLWPHLHAKVVCDLAPLKPRGILCEKPMDVDWDGAVRMHEACKANGVPLMINHQRRFNTPFREAKRLLDSGAVGKLVRLEGGWHNFQDSGTHLIDMLFNFAGDADAEWVLAQADARGGRKVFGALQESHGIITWRFKTGVRATYFAGKDYADLGCIFRIVGESGVIEINEKGAPWVRFRKDGGKWEPLDTKDEGIHGNEGIDRGVADFVDSIEKGRPAILGSQNAIRPTEVIFAAYESAWQRVRIDLPLPPAPSALRKLAAECGVDF